MIKKISVIMPVKDGEKYLSEAVDSILAQTNTNYEFIIIDDGSTDATPSILNGYIDPRIVRIKNKQNVGIPTSLNEGIALAKGEYIARMDADDISLPERFEKQAAYLDHHLQIGVVGSSIKTINEQGHIIGSSSFSNDPELMEWVLLFGSPMAHPSVMMRTALVKKAGGYSTKYILSADYDFWGRLSKHTKLANLSETLLYYRVHAESISIKNRTEQNNISREIQRLLLEEYVCAEDAEFLMDALRSDGYAVSRAIQFARLMNVLYLKFTENHHLSLTSKWNLRYNVGHKIYKIVGPFKSSPSAWNWILKALILSPSIIMDHVKQRAR
jgi:glycosyltransferase involved in cell wall biosynthesis